MLMMSLVVWDLCSDWSVLKSSLPNTVSFACQSGSSEVYPCCMYVCMWVCDSILQVSFPPDGCEWDYWQGGKSTLSLSWKTNKATLTICPTSGVSNWRGRGQPSEEDGRNLRKLSRYLHISTRLIYMYTHTLDLKKASKCREKADYTRLTVKSKIHHARTGVRGYTGERVPVEGCCVCVWRLLVKRVCVVASQPQSDHFF